MPIIKSAKKKLRQDKKRTSRNLLVRKAYKAAILAFKKKPTADTFNKLSSMVDIAAKKKIIHKNKASRLKSNFSKQIGKVKEVKKEEKKPAKKKTSKKQVKA